MTDFLYPTQADADNDEWLKEMLQEWEVSGMPYLCFPFADIYPKYFIEHTDQNKQFWLYMYYRKPGYGKDYVMGGQIRYRIHVIGWRPDCYRLPADNFDLSNTKFVTFHPDMRDTVRFICDSYEEIRMSNNQPIMIDGNFVHPEKKHLPALMRNQYVGIAPVICRVQLKIIHTYKKSTP